MSDLENARLKNENAELRKALHASNHVRQQTIHQVRDLTTELKRSNEQVKSLTTKFATLIEGVGQIAFELAKDLYCDDSNAYKEIVAKIKLAAGINPKADGSLGKANVI